MKLHVAALATLFSCLVQEAMGQFSLEILHINDHHSHLEAEDFDLDTADLPESVTSTINTTIVEEVTVTDGGFPSLVSLFNDIEANSAADGVVRFVREICGHWVQFTTPSCAILFDLVTKGDDLLNPSIFFLLVVTACSSRR
jgi:hypothetical protein